jgi:hypothetical protein
MSPVLGELWLHEIKHDSFQVIAWKKCYARRWRNPGDCFMRQIALNSGILR